MPLSGAGDKSRVNDFTSNAASAVKLTALQLDNEFDDIDDALDLAFFRDGRATATGNWTMGTYKIGGLGDAAADADAVSRSFGDARYLLKAQLANGLPVNASITSSVAANALTIALKGADGNDPSASNPVLLPFRSATVTTGTISVLAITAATSLVISSGSTLGMVADEPSAIYVVCFNDAGTARLGAIKATVTASGNAEFATQVALSPNAIASSTAEGGSGGADTAGIFYTGTAVTSKPYVILGKLEWDAGLATPGTWGTEATQRHNWPNFNLPGEVVQSIRGGSEGSAAGTTVLPVDDTIPQSGEGVEFFTQAITPTNKTSLLRVTVHAFLSSTNTADAVIVGALFQDSTADALSVGYGGRDTTAHAGAFVYVQHVMVANTVAATTFAFRAGTPSAGTTRRNGANGSRVFGGVMRSYLIVEEVAA